MTGRLLFVDSWLIEIRLHFSLTPLRQGILSVPLPTDVGSHVLAWLMECEQVWCKKNMPGVSVGPGKMKDIDVWSGPGPRPPLGTTASWAQL